MNQRTRVRLLVDREGWRRYLWQRAKWRAKEKGYEFAIDVEDVCIPDACPITGEMFLFTPNSPRANRPSLDRIVNSRGYVKGNVAVISFVANTLKAATSPDQFRRFVAYVEAAELIA